MLEVQKELRKLENKEKTKILQGFFKTGKGEYGEGDIFIGLTSQQIKDVAKEFREININDLQKLISSKIHEERVCALRILDWKYKKSKSLKDKKKFVDFYLKNTKYINNWDLVDVSCHYIVGDWLLDKDRKILYDLAKSNDLWEKRIAMISCFAFIRKNDFKDALKIAEILLNDKHDLMHKAVGWMLREIGKKNQELEEKFLKKHYKKMPRTMLRYAIERFPEDLRQKYLKGKV